MPSLIKITVAALMAGSMAAAVPSNGEAVFIQRRACPGECEFYNPHRGESGCKPCDKVKRDEVLLTKRCMQGLCDVYVPGDGYACKPCDRDLPPSKA